MPVDDQFYTIALVPPAPATCPFLSATHDWNLTSYLNSPGRFAHKGQLVAPLGVYEIVGTPAALTAAGGCHLSQDLDGHASQLRGSSPVQAPPRGARHRLGSVIGLSSRRGPPWPPCSGSCRRVLRVHSIRSQDQGAGQHVPTLADDGQHLLELRDPWESCRELVVAIHTFTSGNCNRSFGIKLGFPCNPVPASACLVISHCTTSKRDLFALLSAEASTLAGTAPNYLKKIKNQYVSEVCIRIIFSMYPRITRIRLWFWCIR